ncbi:MAG: Ppx/GppA family phosphatase [Burkholderiaceae bacterium]|jgi:exopolyphosphatase/guanosine-5'-triphosphate,3'-diphosphate pyrophosphatase|nr:Ppx/GppA family phosphatase [Burkholderiaceae bacterium]
MSADASRFAVADLGSNSFRLEIDQPGGAGRFQRVEYLKETVRLGSGLDAERRLSGEAMQRGLACLARFGERLAGFAPQQVRAVATQTLREASNREDFLAVAQQALGFPIEVIAGREEARLIYLGVAHFLPASRERRLVVDIGGRSTELIIGQGRQARVCESLRVGSVRWSMRYFPDGKLSARAFERAEIAARAVLEPVLGTHGHAHWDAAYGSSGTVGAVADVLNLAGRAPHPGAITRAGLDWLQERLVKAGQTQTIALAGVRAERKPVIAGGLAVLRTVFDLLGIAQMQHAEGGLRHGVLVEMLASSGSTRTRGRRDVHSAAIKDLARRYAADPPQARRVARAAALLLPQLLPPTDKPAAQEAQRRLAQQLEWAARLHEIGVWIAHPDYHKHGAYVLEQSELSGFSLAEQHRLALLVLGQRGKLRKVEVQFEDGGFMRQLLALRLAVLLSHARRDPKLHGIALAADRRGSGFTLTLPAGWRAAWPQSAHLLNEEEIAWQRTPWRLRVIERRA